MSNAEKLHLKRVKAIGALVLLQLQEPSYERDEAIYLLEEYIKLMDKPIDPKVTRGNIV